MSSNGGFPEPHWVEGRASVADLFPHGERIGLYMLHFSNGELCVGQTVDVVRRYVQHRRERSDIERISFMPMAKEALLDEEHGVVEWLASNGRVLRSVPAAPLPGGRFDLDLVLSPGDQRRWLRDPAYLDDAGTRVFEPELRRRHHRRFGRFVAMPQSVDVISVLRDYASVGLPAPVRTELSFWRCFCLPDSGVLARVVVEAAEVAHAYEGTAGTVFSFEVSAESIRQAIGRSFLRRNPTLRLGDRGVAAGGEEWVHVEVEGVHGARRLLHEDKVIAALRRRNLQLMRRGPCSDGGLHCLDLADELLAA